MGNNNTISVFLLSKEDCILKKISFILKCLDKNLLITYHSSTKELTLDSLNNYDLIIIDWKAVNKKILNILKKTQNLMKKDSPLVMFLCQEEEIYSISECNLYSNYCVLPIPSNQTSFISLLEKCSKKFQKKIEHIQSQSFLFDQAQNTVLIC